MFVGVIINLKFKEIDTKYGYSDERESAIVCYLDDNGILVKKRISLIGYTDAQYYHVGDIVLVTGDSIEHISIYDKGSSKDAIKKLEQAINQNKTKLSEQEGLPDQRRINSVISDLNRATGKPENGHSYKL